MYLRTAIEFCYSSTLFLLINRPYVCGYKMGKAEMDFLNLKCLQNINSMYKYNFCSFSEGVRLYKMFLTTMVKEMTVFVRLVINNVVNIIRFVWSISSVNMVKFIL